LWLGLETALIYKDFLPFLVVEAVIGELVSARLFPVLRENTGKFVDSSLKKTIIRGVRSANSMAYQLTSLSVKTGKISVLSGKEI